MSTEQNRRTFLKTGILLGAGTFFNNPISTLLAKTSGFLVSEKVDLAVVKGDDYYANTLKAVEELGGMEKFVGKNSTVGLLVNSRYNKPGTFVKPEITIAVINMCLAAGAKKIISLENVTDSYWRLSAVSRKYSDAVESIRHAGGNFRKVKIPKAKSLKEAEVEKDFLECDAYINIPIFKQHEGIRITGCLKNLMGLTSHSTNYYFHNGSNSGGGYNDIVFLSQCIADINLIRKPDLCIADATEYITTNGPFGPGNVVKSKKVIAGTDIVAVDSIGAKILGYNHEDVLPISLASKIGLDESDLTKKKIKEIS